ncbi:hypothetical protein GCM10011323_34320 [Pontibacter amylolyticus]|uniref:Uncharacterized protein n=1 Tax=Pontibacter amylolyticus TaxID=1424080 RepID=A0ABQ1WGB2_9BACT|nr:hypothetical protein GCM10011323_34320 [Pontibacter amylolyticus]
MPIPLAIRQKEPRFVNRMTYVETLYLESSTNIKTATTNRIPSSLDHYMLTPKWLQSSKKPAKANELTYE